MAGSYADGVLRERIVGVLQQHPEGLTIQDISRLIGTHRHTATKYLFELIGAGVVHRRPVGSATLHYLKPTCQPSPLNQANQQTQPEKQPFEAI